MAAGTIGAIDSGLLMLLGALCLVIVSVSMLRRSGQRGATSRDLTRESLARLRDQREVRQSMDELLVQLEEVSRRINAQVDTRFVKLETVIRDADERITKLCGLLEGPRPVESQEFQPGFPTARRSIPATGESEEPPVAASAAPSPASEGREERFRRIYELADAGTAPIAIADALQMPLGEVELILRLRELK